MTIRELNVYERSTLLKALRFYVAHSEGDTWAQSVMLDDNADFINQLMFQSKETNNDQS